MEVFAARRPGAVKHLGDFQLSCALPFPAVASGSTSEAELHDSMDANCPNEGTAKTDEGKEQNRRKNNFCATGEPSRKTVAAFRTLQNKVDADASIRYGVGNVLPADRTPLEHLGEGTVVEFIGYVYEGTGKGDLGTRYSETPETVNCNFPTRTQEELATDADVHVELGESLNPASKDRITAEVIPHFRLPQWTPTMLLATREGKVPVRIRGQLFFDGAHKPCDDDGVCYRASSWEIHPIYEIAVCSESTLAKCKQPSATWTDLEGWSPE
jgi:hypothetical protein